MEFNRCFGCMRELSAPGAVCPHCGYDNTNDPKKQPSHVLPCGTVLNGKFIVGRILGQGGFGITYIAWNLVLEKRVCIKEYFPSGAAMRSATQSQLVLWGGSEDAQNMKANRESFIREARKAVKLSDLSSVVEVLDVFYENETAYIVMDYIEGETLKNRLLRTNKTLTEKECVELLAPMMEDLEKAHKLGIIHRDIKPDNIMISSDGEPKLLDMGAAKDLGKKGATTFTSAAVSHGFSPKEQYRSKGNIGSWTDVYAMSATIYYCVTGKVPPASLDRDDGDELDLRGFSPAFAMVLEKGMALRVEDRIQTMGELLAALKAAIVPSGDVKQSVKTTEKAPEQPEPVQKHAATEKKKNRWPLLICAAALALAVIFIPGRGKQESPLVTADPGQPAEAVITAAPIPELSPSPTSAPVSPTPEPVAEETGAEVSIGNLIRFGHYEQDNNLENGPETIEWLVINVDKQDNKALLLSQYCLDVMPYHSRAEEITWESCSLRAWLNQDFLDRAFSSAEKEAILLTTVDNRPEQNLPTFQNDLPANDTADHIFLLSYKEAFDYLPYHYDRICHPTAYAKEKGSHILEALDAVWWWLRTPSMEAEYGLFIDFKGEPVGLDMSSEHNTVRPAFWLDLSCVTQADVSQADSTRTYLVSDYGNSGVYSGETADGMRNGYGIMRYYTGSVYEGEWKNDKRHGYGKLTDSDGNVTEGEWIDDEPAAEGAAIQEPAAEGVPAQESAPLKIDDTVAVGDTVSFGRYEQDNDVSNGAEAIDWIVLDVDTKNGKALLLSQNALDCQPYHNAERNITWETSSLRLWLNETFFQTAFDSNEQAQILTSTVENGKRECKGEWNTDGGGNTEDRVYLLSYAEAGYYFESNRDRSCKPTPFACAQGSYSNSVSKNCFWWLRSPGEYQSFAAGVRDNGSFGGSVQVNNISYAVRPVLWVAFNDAPPAESAPTTPPDSGRHPDTHSAVSQSKRFSFDYDSKYAAEELPGGGFIVEAGAGEGIPYCVVDVIEKESLQSVGTGDAFAYLAELARSNMEEFGDTLLTQPDGPARVEGKRDLYYLNYSCYDEEVGSPIIRSFYAENLKDGSIAVFSCAATELDIRTVSEILLLAIESFKQS